MTQTTIGLAWYFWR